MNLPAKAPYIIMAPPYRNSSGGVRALHELRNHLESSGYEAKIFQGGDAPPNAIVIYPETVSGNPMKARTVVRYVLNYPGLLGGDSSYSPNDIIFTYSPAFYPTAPLLTVPIIEPFFRDYGLPRSGGCFWVGKGAGKVDEIPETSGMAEITYSWPETREELARFLNTKETFYSYDDFTALAYEAKLCGCKVIIIPGEQEAIGPTYDELIKNFDIQLDRFIRITQDAAAIKLQISFGCLINSQLRFDMVLRQSQIEGKLNYVHNAESATKGLNILLEKAEQEGSDIAVLCHQDMYFRSGWVDQVRYQISMLPDSWVCAGIIGKDAKGIVCGKMHDMRMPNYFDTSDIHSFPHPACCFDECVIIINLKKGFRFDTLLDGFDLYGTLCVLQTWEMGGTAWVIDAFCEHYCMRPFTWFPPEEFRTRYKMLYDRFSTNWNIDSTALGLSPVAEERLEQIKEFMTSAAPFDEEKTEAVA
jgi:hypothetical protein